MGPVLGPPPRGPGAALPGPDLRISSAMALWVRFSSFSSFLATSLLRSLWKGGGGGQRLKANLPCGLGPSLPTAPWTLGTTLPWDEGQEAPLSFSAPSKLSTSHPRQSQWGRDRPHRPTQRRGLSPDVPGRTAFRGPSRSGPPVATREGRARPAVGPAPPPATRPPNHRRFWQRTQSPLSQVLGFRGHRPRALLSPATPPPAGAAPDADVRVTGTWSPCLWLKGKQPPGHEALSPLSQPRRGGTREG